MPFAKVLGRCPAEVRERHFHPLILQKSKNREYEGMNWINGFEILCYIITAVLFADIIRKKDQDEFMLFVSGCLAGFTLELLAVRVTGIYHYSTDFYISIGTEPYQFPFFGGLMWGGLTVCALRLAKRLNFGKIMTALATGWLIVSMDLLLDVAAIRLNGGFWVWDGRPITLDITHHMFMSVIWVNFLGYMFETPAVAYLAQRFLVRGGSCVIKKIFTAIGIGLAGVAVVGVLSGISLFLNKITDEWFACVAFVLLWIFILIRIVIQVIKELKAFTVKGNKDWTVIIVWAAMYGYCLAALVSLGIFNEVPLYGVLSVLLATGTLVLSVAIKKQ